jgi:apolipoprotein N-acyltransferase
VTRPHDSGTRRAFLYVSLTLTAVLVYGAVRFPLVMRARNEAPSLRVGLVQPHLSIAQKHDPSLREINLALQQDMSRELQERGAELVIWPESAYPHYIPRTATRDHDGDRAVRRGFDVPIVFGALSVGRDRRRYNSSFLIRRDGRLNGPADKNELLIFGEYIPFYDDIELLQRWFPQAWNFTPGDRPGLLVDAELRVGMLNCYEDILPGYVRRSAARSPNLLVNITNDTWFGDTAEPHQHAASARFRAIEHRVDLIRSVNSGISTLVASTGEVLDRTPIFVRTGEIVEARLTEAGTIYTAVGDSFAWAMTFAIPLLLIFGRKRFRSESQ